MAGPARLITAMVTPFDEQGAVAYDRAAMLAEALVDSGSGGLVVTGSTGESATLRRDEKLALYSAVKEAVGDRAWIVAGTGTYSTTETIELTQEAEALGVDAALVVVPYYNKPTQDGLYRHFSAIAESTTLPCILYNVPSRTVTNLNAETAIRLSEVPNIVGIKEASGDFAQIKAIIDGVGHPDFRVWSGNDSDTYAMMELGAFGVVAVASHLAGRQLMEMLDLCLSGNLAAAKAIHDRLSPLFKGLFIVSNPIPVKYALNQIGFPVGGYRLPLTEPDDASAERIMAAVRACSVDLPLPARS